MTHQRAPVFLRTFLDYVGGRVSEPAGRSAGEPEAAQVGHSHIPARTVTITYQHVHTRSQMTSALSGRTPWSASKLVKATSRRWRNVEQKHGAAH